MRNEVAALAKELGVSLPADAQVIWVDRQQGMDDMLRAKLQMSRTAFDRISDKLPLKLDALRPGAGRLGTDHDQWNPHATKGLRSGQVAMDGARFLDLGIADDGQGSVTLFLLSDGT